MFNISREGKVMTVLSVFHWLGHTAVGRAMQHSTYGVAIVEMVHLLALAIFGGTILLVDLRLFGIGLKRQSASGLHRELSPLFWGSFACDCFVGNHHSFGRTHEVLLQRRFQGQDGDSFCRAFVSFHTAPQCGRLGNESSFVGLGKINRGTVSGTLACCRFCRTGDWISLEVSC